MGLRLEGRGWGLDLLCGTGQAINFLWASVFSLVKWERLYSPCVSGTKNTEPMADPSPHPPLASATLASLFLEHPGQLPTPGSLDVQCHLPGMFFLQFSPWLAPSHLSQFSCHLFSLECPPPQPLPLFYFLKAFIKATHYLPCLFPCWLSVRAGIFVFSFTMHFQSPAQCQAHSRCFRDDCFLHLFPC